MTVRRTELTCPAHSLKMMRKAAESEADEVIFDLEDACAVSKKVEARSLLVEALKTCVFTGGKIRAYRINGVETAWCYRDVVEVLEAVGEGVDVVVIPKVRSADEVRFVDRLITQVEMGRGLRPGRIKLEALVETASAVLKAEEVAAASPRLVSLIFGVTDYAADTGARDFKADHLELFAYPRAHLLAAARAAGLDAIDGVTVQVRDLAACERDARAGAKLGFDGKWAIHPSQVPIINAAFTPTPEEIERATRLVEAYARADVEAGVGAIVVDDEMIDAATLKLERQKLAVARRAGLVGPEPR